MSSVSDGAMHGALGLPASLCHEWFETLERLVYLEARRFEILDAGKSEEDLRQVGWIGALQAANRFDPERGVPFPQYARSRIRGAMLDELRKRTVFAQPLDCDHCGKMAADMEPEAVTTRADVIRAVNRLPLRQRQMIELVCLRDGSVAKIARISHRPVREVQREYWAALRFLRIALLGYEPAWKGRSRHADRPVGSRQANRSMLAH